MKFLSVDWTTASTRPRRQARVTSLHSAVAWTPYALLTTWPTSSSAHIFATSEHASPALGAKHEVDVTTQHTLAGPAASTAARTASRSVHSWSPTSLGDTTTSSSPAESTALTQVFWSRRHHTTLVAVFGRLDLTASSTNVRVMPVARGRTNAGPMSSRPAIRMASATRRFVSLLSRDEPAAFGCSAATSPERPMPCARFQCLRATSGLYTLASRSPTPTLSRKLLESIMAASERKLSMLWSSQPSLGRRRSERSEVTSLDLRAVA